MGTAEEYFGRRVVPAHGASWPFEGRAPDDLDRLVRERTRRLADGGRHTGNRVLLGVAVERRDGMTCDAERARRWLAMTVDRRWRQRHLSGSRELQVGPIDELARLLGSRRAVWRVVRTSGLAPELRRDWIWWGAVALAVLACGAVTAALTALGSRSGAGAAAGVAFASVAGLVGLISRNFAQELTLVVGPRAARKLEQVLATEPQDSEGERRFRDGLLALLRDERRNRAVVIDDFGRLRTRTRTLVTAYLENPGPRGPEELWLLFEQGLRPGRTARRASRQPSAPHLAQLRPDPTFDVWQCRQQVLTPGQKERLLRKREPHKASRVDPRRRYRGIADVLDRPRDETATVDELQQQLRDSEPQIARAFALLALAATVPAPARVAPQELVAVLRGSSAPSTNALERLLLGWFPPELRKPVRIQETLRSAIQELEALFEDRPGRRRDGRVQVAPHFADAFATHYHWAQDACDLPPADHAHAFWALYWHRVLTSPGGWQAAVVERLLAHLCALREPEHVRTRHGAQTARALAEAAIAGIDASLALCVRGIAEPPGAVAGEAVDSDGAGAVDRAHLLLSGERATADRRLMLQLLAAGWSAYMLTGESRLVETLSGLAAECRVPSAPADELTALYLETVPRGANEVPLLPSPDDPECTVLADHARARAAWLAQLVWPFTADGDEWLDERVLLAAPMLEEVAMRALERMGTGRGGIAEALDYATLCVVVMWSELLGAHGGRLEPRMRELLGRALEAATERRAERAAPGAATDFVLDGLMRELEAMCRADTGLEHFHVMWHNLELYELADLTALAWDVAPTRAEDADENGMAGYLVGLSDSEDRAINRVEAELLTATASERTEAVGLSLAEAGCVAIDSGLGPALVFELCKLIATAGSSLGDLGERLLAGALDAPDGQRRLLDVPDEVAWVHVLSLVNCVKDPDSEMARELSERADERRERMVDPWYADLFDQILEYAEAKHRAPQGGPARDAMLERWRTRIWTPGRPPSLASTASEREVAGGSSSTAARVTFTSASSRWGGEEAPPEYEGITRDNYAWILKYLWSRGVAPSLLVDDACRLLVECAEPSRDYGYVVLAHHVSGWQGLDQAVVERAVQILRDGVKDAESLLEALMLHRIYLQLAEHDAEHAQEHRNRAAYWRVQDELLEQERLFKHDADHQSFEVFWHHYARVDGLPCDLAGELVRTPVDGGVVAIPDPIVFDAHGLPRCVSGAFLRVGHTLVRLHPTAREHDAHRARVNRLAHEHIDALYALLIGRSNVPPTLRRLFEQQRKRFEEL